MLHLENAVVWFHDKTVTKAKEGALLLLSSELFMNRFDQT